MKKAILMITAALALLLGCNESLSLLTKITITSEVKEVYVGGTLQLTASVEPADVPEAVVWSSSDEKTATVDQKGVVTGVKEGTVTVKLASKADENMCDTVEITVVKNPNPVTVASVVIMDGETSLNKELTVKAAADENGAYTQEKAFQAVVNFSDGSEGRYDETVSWSLGKQHPEGAFALSAEGVLSFNLTEKTGTEAALGSAVIEAVSNYDGTTKTAVIIKMVDASAPDSLEIVDESGYGFEGGTLALFEGGSGVTAQVFVNPTSKPQEAEWSVEPADAVKILLPDSQEETTVSGSAVKVLLKKGTVEDGAGAVVTVTQDGVSASLSVSFPKAEITLGGYEDNRWIEGEPLTLTAADASFDITSVGGTPVDGNVWTVPAPAAGVDSEDTSIDCECLSVYGESFTVSVTGKVYSSEHIRYDGGVFKTVKVFDFTSTGVANLGEVKFKDQDTSAELAWPASAEASHDHVTVSNDGSSFNVVYPPPANEQNKDVVVLPIADLDWTLMMLDVKWSGDGTKPNMYVGNGSYGYSFYKLAQGKSFFLGPDTWNPAAGSNYAIAPPAGEFNQYWVYDDGTNRSMRLNEESIYHATASFGGGKKLATETAVQNMSFGNDQGTATFTLKTVAFYKAAE